MKHLLLGCLGLLGGAWLAAAADNVVISEFMARNRDFLANEGAYPDWIELHNTGTTTVNLDGWFLTQDTNHLVRWRLPATNLVANGYLVVFADRQNRAEPGQPLHTDFALNGDGEYLALLRPDLSVATEFAPVFPPQYDNISYGDGQVVAATKLVNSGANARLLVPRDDSLGTNWTRLDFTDTAWSNVVTGIGFASAGSVASSGLYAYWPVQEGSGTIASNLAPGGVNATISGATWITNDPVRGTVLRFDGSSSYVSAGTLPRMGQTTSNFTWSFWYKQNSAANLNGVILGNRAGGVQSPLQFIKFTPSNFEYYRGANIGFIPYTIPSGQWLHLAVVKNGAAMAYFVNGAVVGASTAGGDIEANPLYWGGDPGYAGEYTDGWMDDVSLWTRALGTNEISLLAAGQSVQALLGIGGFVTTDVKSAMTNQATAYLRVPFSVGDADVFNTLKLRMKYDDGFVAYLNGIEVARRNAPDPAPWNASATAEHTNSAAVVFEDIDISGFLDLVQNGPNVLAFQGLNLSPTDADFLILPELEAATITGLGARYFGFPTPGAVNNLGVIDYVADTKFSPDRGFYDTNITVTITCATPGAVIRYTTNGAAPTETTGFVYTGPIPITNTTVLRAAAYRPGWQPSAPDAQTYLFLSQVLQQTGAGWPTYAWGGSTVDYAMDPRVVASATYAPTIRNDLKSLPVLCLSMNPEDFFGSQGIYVNTSWRGVTSERAAAAELFFPDGSRTGFQINCGIRIAGNASRTMTPKHGLRLLFKSMYGPPKLNYRLFDDTEVDSFDGIALRPHFNMSWVRTDNSGPLNNANADGAERTHALYVRDQYTKDLQLAMGWAGAHGRYVHLYINGLYWGLYNPCERTTASFAATYLGGDKEQYDAIFAQLSTPTVPSATDGDKAAWNQMFVIANAGLTNAAQYAEIQKFLDVTNLADYMMVNFYTCTYDWPWQNWNALRKRETNAQFRFFIWDAEYSVETPPWVNEDRTTVGDEAREAVSPAFLYRQLRQNAEWRLLFADRVRKHCFNNGALTTNQTIPRFVAMCNVIDRAIVGESARWGDVVRTTQPYTRDVEWVTERNRLLTQFFPQRTTNLLQQFRNAGLYPGLDAPAFNSHGAIFTNQFALTLSAPAGTVYFTTNGSDPRLPGGALSLEAQAYTAEVILTQSHLVRARAFYTNTWSALNEAAFVETTPIPLHITELMYHPAPPAEGSTNSVEDFEYLELRNVGAAPLELAGVSFTRGLTFTFPELLLAPGQRVLVVKNRAAFEARYGTGFNIAGEYRGTLSDNGEGLRLEGALGQLIQEFDYADWLPLTDGLGFSLVIVDDNGPLSAWSTNAGWRVGTPLSAARGLVDPAPRLPPIVVNEVLTHTTLPVVDVIELFNPTTNAVDVGGWCLTDDWQTPFKYRIPTNTVIPPNGFWTVDEAQFNPPGARAGFGLSGLGDRIYLFSGGAATNLTGYIHGFEFGAAANGVTFGRYVNSLGEELFPAQASPTLGTNNAGPRIGPVVITEIMYHPADTNGEEYVGLQNISALPVDFQEALSPGNPWRLAGAGFDFPTNMTLAAGQRLVVVSGDPTAFRAKYHVPAEVLVVGPFAGTLQNAGENLELQRPDAPVWDNGQLVVPYLVVDAVRYHAHSPWPDVADGLGPSLHRISPTAFGNDPTNWIGAAPAPGQLHLGGDLPVLLTHPASQTVLETYSVTFSASASGTGPFVYAWFCNGANVAVTFDGTLTLTNVQLSQQGSYAVTVMGAAGVAFSTNAWLTVLPVPRFITLPHSAKVLVGSSTNFAALATGTGQLTYQWRFNGADLPGATNNTLSVTNVQITNEGIYQVVVTDEIGPVISPPAYLTPLVRITVVQALVNQTNWAGATVSFTIGISGYPPPFGYQFRKSSVPLSDYMISHASNYTFSLTNIQYGDAGLYRIVVTNAATPLPGIPSSANLTVWSPPVITNQPVDATVNAGQTTNFIVRVTGNAPFGYQWWREGTNLIVWGTGATLTVTNAQAGINDGGYKVIITNAYGWATSQVAYLIVRQPPSIVSQPASVAVAAGANATFSVVAAGGGPYGYQWFFNNVNPVPGAINPALILTNVQSTNAGYYRVVVTNELGAVTSAPANLTVLTPPGILVQPTNQAAAIGSNATFTVVAEGSEPLSYQWYFNATNLVEGATNAGLVLTNVQPTNAGAYTVVITNLVGTRTSQIANLTVRQPPSIVSQPASVAVVVGANATFSVVAAGGEPYGYQWFFNDVNPVPGAVNPALTLTNVQSTNAGHYRVVVTNELGAVTSAPANLTVLTPPGILVQPTNQTTVAGSNANFTVVAAGSEPLSYQWYFNATNLVAGATNASLVLTNVQPANAGAYTVVITNLSGALTSEVAALALANLDTDSDGMPDDWESAHGLNPRDPGDAALDADGDGMRNWQEYVAGTDPNNPRSYLKVEASLAGGGAALTFEAQANKSYTLQYTDALQTGAWSRLTNVLAQPIHRLETLADPNPGTRRYYRLVTPALP